MIATWMLYCVLCGVGLSLAAALAERVLLAARGPVRFVWIAALALAIALPVAAYRFAPRATRPAPAAVADVSIDSTAEAAVPGLAVSSPRRASSQRAQRSWRASIAAADAPLSVAWATLSAALLAHFVCGVVALAWMRRWWRRDTVLGVDVLVSQATGPALVGAVSPAIVVPEWTLSMDADQVALMLRHESEHRRAHDGQLLTAAQLALILMPWNLAIWWLLLRLRIAVELDCDARVLRDADARSYGDLLLEVARPRRRLMLLGATAFAERASQLERRIRAIGMRRGGEARGVRALACGIGVAVVSLAWVAPRPAVPPLPARAVPISPDSSRTVRAAGLPRGASTAIAPADSVASQPNPGSRRQPPIGVASATRRAAPDSIGVLAIPPVSDNRQSVNLPAPAQPVPPPAVRGTDSLFDRLFGGIALTPDQDAAARAQILRLQLAQQAQMATYVKAILESMPLRASIQAQADSSLLGLLSTDEDRAIVRARFAPQIPGGRGRSGGPGAPVGAAGGRGGFTGDTVLLGGGRRGARVGGGGRGGVAADPTETMFRRLFDGVALSADQESGARTIIAKLQADLRAVGPGLPITILILRPFTNQIVMSPESASTLTAILTNDGDRATLLSRITLEVRTTPTIDPLTGRPPAR